jgi:hypothetical protein
MHRSNYKLPTDISLLSEAVFVSYFGTEMMLLSKHARVKLSFSLTELYNLPFLGAFPTKLQKCFC